MLELQNPSFTKDFEMLEIFAYQTKFNVFKKIQGRSALMTQSRESTYLVFNTYKVITFESSMN